MKIGIDLISFYTPGYYLDLSLLAKQRERDPECFQKGIGQFKMSVTPPDEDIVSMGANAAKTIVDVTPRDSIKAIIVATETAIDQSKSAAIFIHKLLELSPHCRAIEMKQACYSGTFALQSAIALVALNPHQKVLVICTDIARYELNSRGEATQGAGAVAMLISKDPRLVTFDSQPVFVTDEVMDFWRPNYRSTAMVDGQYSTKVYLNALKQCWHRYLQQNNQLSEVNLFCFHLPFTRMAEKALKQLCSTQQEFSKRMHAITPGLKYNQTIGNSYTASLYLSLCSLFDYAQDLALQRVGFYSYGSGFMAEMFSGTIEKDYQHHLFSLQHLIDNRQAVDFQQYLDFHQFKLPENGSQALTPHFSSGTFRFKGIDQHHRLYETT